MFWNILPRWVKIPGVVGLVALAGIELNKDFNESWFSGETFAGAGAEGISKAIDPLKTEADSAAGKEISAARRTVDAQWQGLAADAAAKRAAADADTESEQELLAKQAKKLKLTAKESLRIQELKKARGEAEVVEAQSTAARAEAEANRQAAELNQRLISSLQRNDGDILKTFYDIFIPRGAGLGK